MTATSLTTAATNSSTAREQADWSLRWYSSHARVARVRYQILETVALVLAASIPVAAVIAPHDVVAPAVLGGVVAVLSGLRGLFHWQSNYLRFTGAASAIDEQIRLWDVGATPYDDSSTKDQRLAAAVARIQSAETSDWMKAASAAAPKDGGSST